MNNIEIFKEISALAFSQLYENFPLKINLSPSDLALTLDDECWDESLKAISEIQMKLLEIEIRLVSPSRPLNGCHRQALSLTHIFKDVCLTVKGLESIESDSQRGNKLLKATKDLAIEALDQTQFI